MKNNSPALKQLDSEGRWVIFFNRREEYGRVVWSSLTGDIEDEEAEMVLNAILDYLE